MSSKKKAPQFIQHPWHGVEIGDDAPRVVTVYIEIVQTDVLKYEIDKDSGLLRVDRPQKYSSQCPTLYGFIPQTLCDDEVGLLSSKNSGRNGIKGDGDALDICVLSERPILHGNVLLRARPIGGLRVIDGDQADDKIISALYDDGVYGEWRDLKDCPENLIQRLEHYFLSYKQLPGEDRRQVEIAQVYGAEEAHQVIEASRRDYENNYEKASFLEISK